MTDREIFRTTAPLDGEAVAYNNDPEAVCPGGQALETCVTTREMLEGAQRWLGFRPTQLDEFVVLTAIRRQCQACNHLCNGAVELRQGKPTGLVRITSKADGPFSPGISE